jgi:hypothetical protein
MRCQQCNNYFCWQCGGPGGACNSFQCTSGRGERLKHKDYKYNLSSVRGALLHNVMGTAASFAQQRAMFLRQAEAGNREEEEVGLDAAAAADIFFVIRLVLMRHALQSSSGDKSVTAALKALIQRLELILHARTERKHSKFRAGRRFGRAPTPREIQKKEQIEERKRAGLALRGAASVAMEATRDELEAILADRELAELLEMSPDNFRAAAVKAVNEAVVLLERIARGKLPEY